MKKNYFLFFSALALSATLLIGCGSSEKKQNTPGAVVKEQYRCPMKCSEELFDKPGKCPVCEMELEKVSES
ncbi:MAG: heavy metal-binding domain-containing protein [Bacteroidia bacterium]|jgi:hypothetical protein